MAITGTNRGSGGNTSSQSTWSIVPGSNFNAYSTAVLCLAYNNDASDGSDTINHVTDSLGNNWIRLSKLVNSPGGAQGDGVVGRIFYSYQENGTLTTGSTIYVTFIGSLTAKRYTLTELSTDAANGIVVSLPRYIGGETGNGTSTSITTTSLTSGDALIAMVGAEVNDTSITADSDSTNGTWSTLQQSGGTGMSIYSQFKILTGSGTQTYDLSSITSCDYVELWAVFTERTSNSIAVVPIMVSDSASSSTTLVATVGNPIAPLTGIDDGIFNGCNYLGSTAWPRGKIKVGDILVMNLYHDSGVTLDSISGLGSNSYTTYENTSYSGQKIIVVQVTQEIAALTDITFTFSGNTIKGLVGNKISSIRNKSFSIEAGPYEYASETSDSTFVTNSIPENSAVIVAIQGTTYPNNADTDTTNGFWELLNGGNTDYSGVQAKVVTAEGAQTYNVDSNVNGTSVARCAIVLTEVDASSFDPFGMLGIFGI